MRLLYVSCHEIHAYDEAKLLSEIGVQTFIVGAKPGHLRPEFYSDPTQGCDFISVEEAKKTEGMLEPGRGLERWLVERFDAVLILSRNDWVRQFWDIIKDKKVIFRMNGQSDAGSHVRLKPFVDHGMILLGYSPDENRRFFKKTRIPHTIRFYKDPQEWKDWNGCEASVMTACQSIDRDGECCNPTAYLQVTQSLPHVLYGPGNENFLKQRSEQSPGPISFEAFKKKMREHRVYLYVGTRPASYTLNFIEAWMTGIPVVSLGPKYNTYEVCELLDQGVDGFFSDNLSQVREWLEKLINDHALAAAIGRRGRAKAIELFGIDTIQKQWRAFFKSIT